MTLRDARLVAGILVAALTAWAVTIWRMWGMDAGPGTDLGTLPWYLGIWVTMMAAMMLPAVLPVVAGLSRTGTGGGAPSFVAGYLVAWIGYGLAAYGVYRAVDAAAPRFLAWDAKGRYVAGAALVVAGLYQLGPLKTVCLRHCRSPLHFVLRRRPGRAGAVRLGAQHGAYCVGCCGGLMLALFALGVMSLFWMAVVAGVVFVEKVAPAGDRLAGVFAIALVALGVWVAASPATVPGLTTPRPMQMQMQSG